MVIVTGLLPPKGNVWYLAYGSNLSSSKFVNDRGIVPLQSQIVRVPGYNLSMTAAGLPYREPSFASIHHTVPNGNIIEKVHGEAHGSDVQMQEHAVTLLGTAYLVTPEQYKHVLASEGGGIAYREAEVVVEPVVTKANAQLMRIGDEALMASSIPGTWTARTLFAVSPRHPAPRPSHRYKVCI